MKPDLKDSITFSLDGSNPELYPHFAYLLQDLWELGSSGRVLIDLLQRNNVKDNLNEFSILDLGCGKGAVSIPVIREFGGKLLGIDAMPEFIETARHLSDQFGISGSCTFKTADIREEIRKLSGFNLILLSSIGPVLGNAGETLKKISGCLSSQGYVFLDDGYIPEGSDVILENVQSEKEFTEQIGKSGFETIDKYVYTQTEMSSSNEKIYTAISRRADELVIQYPEKKNLFEKYLKEQRLENDILENKITCAGFLLKKTN